MSLSLIYVRNDGAKVRLFSQTAKLYHIFFKLFVYLTFFYTFYLVDSRYCRTFVVRKNRQLYVFILIKKNREKLAGLKIISYLCTIKQETIKIMRKIKLTEEQSIALDKIATRSKMNDWFSIDENLIVREIDIHTLIDGVTQYDIGVLNMQDVYVLLNLLNNIRKPLKK